MTATSHHHCQIAARTWGRSTNSHEGCAAWSHRKSATSFLWDRVAARTARYLTIILLAVAGGCSQHPAAGGNADSAKAMSSTGAPPGRLGGMMAGGRGGMSMMRGAAPDTSAAPTANASAAAAANGCPAGDQRLVDEGRAVFGGAGNCFACHGLDARGTALAPNLVDTRWLDIDGSYMAIAGLVRTGVAKPKQHSAPMPALGGAALSGSQGCAVAAYVYSISHR